MSSEEIVLSVKNISKIYEIYDKPSDRLKQLIFPKISRLFGRAPKKYYREFAALKNLSFDIKKRETVGIIGRNGSGKSTLLQIICGTLSPSDGEIFLKGRIAALLELGSGFNTEFTGKENIYLNASILGLSKAEIDERYAAIVEFADIGNFINQKINTYSSGMFVRLAFAIYANIDPDILIIDEALAVGDAYFVHRCMLRLKELQEVGTTIIFVSHDANTVRNFCSQVIWLDQGRIEESGNPSAVVDSYLAYIFNQRPTSHFPLNSLSKYDSDVDNLGHPKFETIIPNIDRRLGDQKCEIVGVALYDQFMRPISSCQNDSSIILRVTFKNNALEKNIPLSLGYIFRNAHGHEIASTNSYIEGVKIKSLSPGKLQSVDMKIDLPCFHPGSYAFTVVAGYEKKIGDIEVSDRIENAIVFNILSVKKVHVMMSFKTKFEIYPKGKVD